MINAGNLVISIAGRDKDRYFLVMKIDEKYVYLCDGKIRKIDKIKKKNIKHVQKTKYFSEKIAKKINKNIEITNKEIRNFIREILVSKEVK